ncbi:MAG: hypothetical protein QOI73_873 [Solirubrobacteraceae bacterium]|nr:hypothetical protein [Solirubrobacteraceae bacterium]
MPAQGNPRRGTRLNIRDVIAEDVHSAMLAHADEIADARDVLRLQVLRDVPGERIALAIADLVADGRVVGAAGAGRIRAVSSSS